jgi:hypothetical protein
MSLFAKMIEEGWWDSVRKESDIDASRFTDKNIDELLIHGRTLVQYDNRSWHVAINRRKPIGNLTGEDFDILELTGSDFEIVELT